MFPPQLYRINILFRDDSYGKEKKKKEGNKKRLEISITVGWLRRPRIESMALWRERELFEMRASLEGGEGEGEGKRRATPLYVKLT